MGVSIPVTVAQALREAREGLAAAGVPSPEVDARLLVGHVLGVRPLELVLHADRHLEPAEESALARLIAERAARRPLQLLLGDVEFYGRRFAVAPGVLIPRPETESVVEVALGAIADTAPPDGAPRPRAADIGTGAGVIGLTLAAERPWLAVWCSDRSWAALELTARNAVALGVSDRVHLVAADLAGALAPGSLDLVASNPPYIARSAIPVLDPEVRDHDPHLALDGGEEGLDTIRRLVSEGGDLLRPGGHLVLEIGEDQGAAVRDLASARGWRSIAIVPDLAGRDRVLHARRGE